MHSSESLWFSAIVNVVWQNFPYLNCLFSISTPEFPSKIFIDPNIPETGEQLAKSNNGPSNCCYEYCDPIAVYKGVCTYCDSTEDGSIDNSQREVESSATPTIDELKELQQRYYSSTVNKVDTPPQTCTLMPGLSLTTSKCEIPYYASSFNTDSLHSMDTVTTPTTVSTSTFTETT